MTSKIGEFDLINRFFKTEFEPIKKMGGHRVILGIGDDCALLQNSPNEELAITCDMLVEGRHFFAGANPEWFGHKALAVNLSDLAAMGAKPIGFTLAIALPNADPLWLEAFSKGLFALAKKFSCPLIGGDTTSGPLNICITAFGSVPPQEAIRRSGALVHDDIWVSGTVGDARLALGALRQEWQLDEHDLVKVLPKLHRPQPQVELGTHLRSIAHAALDVSDGLLGDLRHILTASQMDASVFLNRLPLSLTLQKQSELIRTQCAATGGDDYEICFTAPIDKRHEIAALSKMLSISLTNIGSITNASCHSPMPHIALIDGSGRELGKEATAELLKSFDHFA